jgi:hypothetical protein
LESKGLLNDTAERTLVSQGHRRSPFAACSVPAELVKQEDRLIKAMRDSREQYKRVSEEFDGFVHQVHESERGSREMREALDNLNALGQLLALALNEYRESAERLFLFYEFLTPVNASQRAATASR